MSPRNVFDNPKNICIENLKLTVNNDGVVKSIPALDPHWVTKRALTMYTPPPSGATVPLGAVQAWKESMQWLVDDLKWLLQMRFNEFWSHIVHYPPCMDMLVSFLQEAYPPYLTQHPDKSVMESFYEAYRRVLIIFSRLVTNKETEAEWMNMSYLAQLIYDKYLFTIPIMFDLCLLYGTNNQAHITKLIKSVFTLQPKYNNDLMLALDFIKQIFAYIAYHMDNRSNIDMLPPTLPDMFKGFSQSFGGLKSHNVANEKTLTLSQLNDFSYHILDCALTLKVFLVIHPPSRLLFRDNEFYSSIINLYENTIPIMYEKVGELGDPKKEPYNEIFNQLDIIRVQFIECFRLILGTTIGDILSNSGDIENTVSTYLAIITDAISEKLFIKDYNAAYSVEMDLDILSQAYEQIDPVKCDFILQAIMTNCYDEPPKSSKSAQRLNNDTSQNPQLINGCHNEQITQNNVEQISQSNNIPEEARIQSLISEVKDILPHLGDGFILKCLEHYGFNSERVINSVLEGTLDDSLSAFDQSLPLIPEDALDVQYLKTGIDRLNVFDNDEFDVMTRDNIDTSKVHKGKRKFKHKDLGQMLNDKSHVKEMKEMYTKYSLVSDEVDLYDDEYDDTYDGGAPELVSEVPAEVDRKPHRQSTVFRRVKECVEESEDEDDEPSSSMSNQPPKDSFCLNPGEVRAQYQARRDMKYGNRSDRDVVGRAKGQGQEKEVLLNRQQKAANKSVRGNHNRRGGAQWKRSQGLLPS